MTKKSNEKAIEKGKRVTAHLVTSMMNNFRKNIKKISDKHGPHITASVILSVHDNIGHMVQGILDLMEESGVNTDTAIWKGTTEGFE